MPLNRETLLQLRDSLETMLNHPSPEAEATFRTCCEAVRADLDAAASGDLETALHVVQQAFHRGPPPTLPVSLAQQEGWQALLAEIDALQTFVLALGQGDLEQSLAQQGLMAGGLKALQANLRHLTWQTQQIAKGDFEQHVDFMGEFSEAFNDMVRALKESQARLQRRERELREVNAELQREVTERQQAEASLRESNANLRREIVERKKIAAQIRESEARYRLLAENMADVVWVLKTDTMTFSYVSPSVEKLRGYTPEEVSQQSIEQVMTPNSLTDIEADLPDRIARFLQGDPDAVTQIDEIEQWCKDGSTVWTEVSTTLVLTPAGAIDVVGVSRDIAERHRAGIRIRASEERFRLAFDEASVGMCFVSLDGHLMRVNRQMGDIFGYAPEALEGLHVNDLTLPEDWDISPTYIDQAASGGEPRAIFEKRYRHRDGHLVWGRVTSAMVRDADGEPQHFISHVQDITEQKRAEEELRQSEQRFATVTNSMEAMIYVADMETYELLFVNQYIRNLFGDVEGQICWQAIQEGQTGPCAFCTNDRLLDNQGKPTGIYTWEFQNTRTERWYQIQDQAIRWTDGRLVRLEVATDITALKEVETALRESEMRYHNLFANNHAVMLLVDPQSSQIVDANPAACTYYGYTHAELTSHLISDINVLSPAKFQAKMQQAQGESRSHFICRHRLASGEMRDVEIYSGPIQLEGKSLLYSIVHDITERRKVEAQIRESEARYRLLAENMADVVWVLQPDTMTFSYISPSVEKMRGYTPEEVLQQSIEQVATPDSLAYLESVLPGRIERFLQGDPDAVNQIYETEQWCKDGSTVWTGIATTLVSTPAGEVNVVGTSRDITERRRNEQQIKQANEELQHRVTELSTLNRVTQAVATQTHLEETLSAIIRETVQLFGAMTGAIGLLDNKRQGQKLLAVYNRDSDGPAEDLIYIPLADDPIASQVIKTGEPLIIADLFTNPRNEINRTFLDHEYDIQFSMTTPLWARGEVIGTFSVARHKSAPAFTEEDTKLAQTTAGQIAQAITNAQYVDKLRQARDEAEAARRAAEDANQAKSTFLANMSHELRTPMNAVLGFAELMSTDANLNETQHENLAIIQRSGDHLLELINDILDLSKIESGRIEIRPTDFDLHVMLQGLSEMFRLRAESKGLTLEFDARPDMPRRIRADEGKLRQVLINLLGNAIKFTESGGITLQVTSEQASATDDDAVSPSATSTLSTVRLHFEVKDTGVGIAPEELAQVFETFVQTESGRQAQTGTGLGLPISQKYVRMMGGDLTVESEVGVGSKFEFDILVEGIETETAKRQRQQKRVVGLAEGQPAYKILIAEDRIDSQTLMLSLLSRVGFKVQVAANGKEAIERWQMWRPDLIFMDIRMPELDGLAATRQIKAMPGGDETAIVAVTASAFEEDRAAILAEGSDNFLRKPYGETDLFDVIARHLDVRYVYGPLPYQLVGPAGEDVKTVDFTLTDLPDDWRAALQQATIEGDLMWMSDLTEEIRASHPRLAKQLSQWVNNFQYEEIYNLIDRLKHTAEQGSS